MIWQKQNRKSTQQPTKEITIASSSDATNNRRKAAEAKINGKYKPLS